MKAEWSQYDREVGLPPLWQAEMRFQYWQGERFFNSLYQDGGWAEVNAVYQRPPASSAQLLHPGLYVADVQPVQVQAPITASVAALGWQRLYEDTFGEVGLAAILEPFLGPERAAAAATGWSGDRYVAVGTSGTPFALALDSVWVNPGEARKFFDALADSLDVRFSGVAQRQYEGFGRLSWNTQELQVVVELRSDHVNFAIAPDRGGLLTLMPPESWWEEHFVPVGRRGG